MEQEAQRRWDEGKLSMCLDDWNGSSISKGCKDAQQCLHLWRAQVEYGRKDRVGKSRETEGRSVVVQGWEHWGKMESDC